MASSVSAELRDSEMGIALNFPAEDGGIETASSSSSPPKLPRRLRRRLLVSKSPITAEDIEFKLNQARLRRQQFYELLSSKARAKTRGPSCHSFQEEDLGKRLDSKLNAAEQKRLSILEKAQTRLARLDELRQAAKAEVEKRFEKEKDELGAKVQLRAKQAEENRMRLLKACSQRRAARRDRATHSLMQRMIKERTYKDCIYAAMYQKRVAAERKRSKLLEQEKARACARILQVRQAVKSVHSQQEIERIKMKDQLEDRLLRAYKQREEYLKQRRSSHHSVQTVSKMAQEQEHISKIARCWRRFVHLQKTTFALAKAFDALGIREESVKSMSFEQLALQIAAATTIQTTKALVTCLESRYLISRAATDSVSSLDNIDHLLRCVASTVRKGKSSTSKKVVSENIHSIKDAPGRPVVLSRYPVRVFLCSYMILGHPDAVFNRRAECENALAQSAASFVQEFELLLRIIIHGPIHSSQKEAAPSIASKITFRSQLEAFDKAWCSYLLRFVEWKDSDARLLKEDLIRAASELELSMTQANKMTPERDVNGSTRNMTDFQQQVTENQNILRDKLQHLSGNSGLEGMETALSEMRSRYIGSKDSACSLASTAAVNSSLGWPAPLDGSLVSVSVGTSELSNTCQSPSQNIITSFNKDATDRGDEVGSILSFKADANGHLNYASLVVGENELLVNEILHEHHHDFVDNLNDKDKGHNSLKEKVRETMEKAFWDGVTDSMKENDSDFSWILKLVTEVRDELCDVSPQTWKKEITESIDIDILSQVLRSGNLDLDYFGKILDFALVTLRKLSAPANDDDMKTTHYKFLKELEEILQADKSKTSRALAITKGLRFVLKQIQNLKREISKARLRMIEPLIKGSAGLEYLRKAFTNRHGSPSDASTSLPITRRWLSSVKKVAEEEWHEYVDSLSAVTRKKHSSGVLPATLRTGGSILVGTKISSQTSTTTDKIDSPSPGKKLPECRGERTDLLIRLGLLKLVSEVSGLNLEVLPETLELNLTRLRDVQSQLQKIIVISTCLLVLRQILLGENLIANPLEMEKIASRCAKQLVNILDTVEDVGIPKIIETIFGVQEDDNRPPCLEKLHARKQIMASMLGKSLQAGDSVFKRVCHAVYLAARGVVLDGNGVEGKQLAEASLRRIGAALLADDLVKVAEVLVVVAVVSCNVHRPWYEELIKNI